MSDELSAIADIQNRLDIKCNDLNCFYPKRDIDVMQSISCVMENV